MLWSSVIVGGMGVSYPVWLSGDEPHAYMLEIVLELVVDVVDLLVCLLISLYLRCSAFLNVDFFGVGWKGL